MAGAAEPRTYGLVRVSDDDLAQPPAAGWYTDPFGRFPLRWWDGAHWTAYARDTEVQWDPSPIEPEVPVDPGLPGLGAAAVGAVVSVVLAIGLALLFSTTDDEGERVAAVVVSQLGLWGGLVGACVFVSHRRGTGSLIRDFDIRFKWIDLGFGFAGAIAGRVTAAVAATLIPWVPTHSLDDAEREVLGDAPDAFLAWVLLIVITCIGAPLIEELYFRGLVQTRLVGRLGVLPGIISASLFFGAAHLLSWAGAESVVNAWAIAVAGVTLGILRQLTGRLGPSIVAHAVFNIQALVVLAFVS